MQSDSNLRRRRSWSRCSLKEWEASGGREGVRVWEVKEEDVEDWEAFLWWRDLL